MRGRAFRTLAAEATGTALLVAIGTGSIVGADSLGGAAQWELAVAWFLAVLSPILLFVDISGAHLNPAVTLALAGSGRVAWAEVPLYVAGQLGGALLGSAAVLAFLGPAAHLGATLPLDGDVLRTLVLEGAFTALLVATVFVLADRGAGRFRWRLLLPPAAVGLSTFLIGPYTGSSLNPARSVAPAILSGTFTDLWVYLAATVVAALALALLWKPRGSEPVDHGRAVGAGP